MRPLLVCLLASLSACHTMSRATQTNSTNEPRTVPSVLDKPVEFVGPRIATSQPASLGEIRIGLFGPDAHEHAVGMSMLLGASLAVEEFNAAGGLNGVPLRLVRRWDADPWRGGSKEMIKLVYEDSVWAVIGSVDGEATHVAEQVVTKAWLPLLSPVSADPTLTYIRIPWMFRLPPDDEEQAATLLRDGILAHSFSSIGLITSTDHDGRVFGEEMREQMSNAQKAPHFHMQLSHEDLDVVEAAERVRRFDADAIVIRLPARILLDLLDVFGSAGMDVPVLLPWVPGLLTTDLEGRYGGPISHVCPFSETENPSFALFKMKYGERYGEVATPSAAYSYDATNMLISSLAQCEGEGLNRACLRDALAGASGFAGVTGPVIWDNAGGSQAQPVLMETVTTVRSR